MHLDNPFHSRDCITCTSTPTCFCGATEQCIVTLATCNDCGSFKCVPINKPSVKKGVSAGAVAGAVVAVVIVLGLVLGLFFWYRRRVSRSNAARGTTIKENVASASDVLTRPDPNEKAIQQAQAQAHIEALVASRSTSQRSRPARSPTNLSASRFVEHTSEHFAELQAPVASRTPTPLNHTQSRPSPTSQLQPYTQNDPFSDTQSIQTTTTGTQDAIPIALVPRSPGGTPIPAGTPESSLRPVRTPESQFNMEHLNVSKDTFAANSVAREASGGSNAGRNSYMSSLTTATDFINEAPVIVTQSQRQVLGISKAEVLRTTPSTPNTPMTADSMRAHPPSMLRPSMRSPLAATSFGPSDVVTEEDMRSNDPFGDEHSPSFLNQPPVSGTDRPTSMATVATGAGTIIADISSAKRVNIGIARSASIKSTGVSSTRVLHRMTSGKLVSPTSHGDRSPDSNASTGTLQQQQERALAIAQAKAREQGGGPDMSRRVSGSSVITNSTRADSILESFPFVPPSPISNRPMRTPPRSPLGQPFASAAPALPSLPEARPQDTLAPNRAQLGMSTGSQLSTASTGLGAFTFQIASDAPPSPMPPAAFQQPSSAGGQRQRASLDTLALTSALSSYPLDGFAQADAHYPPRN